MRRIAPLPLVLSTMVGLPLMGALAQNPQPPAPIPTVSSGSSSSDNNTPPPSAPLPQQVVFLRSGAIIRGTIVEYIPETRIVLELATGQVREIPWSDVARTSWVDTPDSDSPAALVMPPSSASASPPPPPSGVLIHLISDRPVHLEARPKVGRHSWTKVCDAPCGSVADVHRKMLRVAGPDTRASNEFFIDAQSGEETLEVKGGSNEIHRIGQISLITGLGLALAGGLAFGLGRVENKDAAKVGGAVGMTLGGVGVGVALPLLGTSRTVVRNGKGQQVGGYYIPTRF